MLVGLKRSHALTHPQPDFAIRTSWQAWMVEPVVAAHDLDNLILHDIGSTFAQFDLEYLLVEGNCHDALTNEPPAGLELLIGTAAAPHVSDTLVMANFGYFQLKVCVSVVGLPMCVCVSVRVSVCACEWVGWHCFYPPPLDLNSLTHSLTHSLPHSVLCSQPRLRRAPGRFRWPTPGAR